MKRSSSLSRLPACHVSGARRFFLAAGPLKSKQLFLRKRDRYAPRGFAQPGGASATCVRGAEARAQYLDYPLLQAVHLIQTRGLHRSSLV